MPSESGIPQGSLFYRNPFNFMVISDSSLLFKPQILESPLFSHTPYSVCQDIWLGLPSGLIQNPHHCYHRVQVAITRHLG